MYFVKHFNCRLNIYQNSNDMVLLINLTCNTMLFHKVYSIIYVYVCVKCVSIFVYVNIGFG